MQQTPHYKLYFFNAMGRAEIIRLIFAHCAVPYEDIRLTKDEFEQKKDSSFSLLNQHEFFDTFKDLKIFNLIRNL